MVKPEMIPDEVVKAALLTDERLGMRTVIAAALDAWPGAIEVVTLPRRHAIYYSNPAIILPLPQEKRDD